MQLTLHTDLLADGAILSCVNLVHCIFNSSENPPPLPSPIVSFYMYIRDSGGWFNVYLFLVYNNKGYTCTYLVDFFVSTIQVLT